MRRSTINRGEFTCQIVNIPGIVIEKHGRASNGYTTNMVNLDFIYLLTEPTSLVLGGILFTDF